MAAEHQLRTPRLILRQWRPSDAAPFAAMNADPMVMEHFPSTLTAEQSAALMAKLHTGVSTNGFGLWAVEIPDVSPFIGFVGIATVAFEAGFTPAVEVGWRLAQPSWGQGYATEAAQAAAAFAFDELNLTELVAFTSHTNERSIRVMNRLGMTHLAADDFDHPRLPEGHPLRPHVLYRWPRATWLANRASK